MPNRKPNYCDVTRLRSQVLVALLTRNVESHSDALENAPRIFTAPLVDTFTSLVDGLW